MLVNFYLNLAQFNTILTILFVIALVMIKNVFSHDFCSFLGWLFYYLASYICKVWQNLPTVAYEIFHVYSQILNKSSIIIIIVLTIFYNNLLVLPNLFDFLLYF